MKYDRTEALASSGDWVAAAVSTSSAPGWLARYPPAAASTPLDVAARPLALHGAAAALGVDTKAAAHSALTISAPNAQRIDVVMAWLLGIVGLDLKG
ncbi:hypothetical protein MSZK_19480 [Mycobacterium sp. shizuoka-1]|nr:hypothetical protein MSZK_19480 [Mycobacterium sp. shizuoka-1]